MATDESYVAPDDSVFSLGDKAESILHDALARMDEALKNEGVKTFKIKCSTCGHGNTATVKVVDGELLRKYADTVASITFRAAAAKKDLAASNSATKILKDRSEMSDEDLAAHICSLEAELAAETPERRGLSALMGRLTEGQVPEAIKRMKEIVSGGK